MTRESHDSGPSYRPPLLSVSIAVAAGAVALLSLSTVPEAAAIAGVAVVALGGGLFLASRRLLEWGGLVFVVAIVVGGVFGASVSFLALAALSAVVAWDVADHAFDLGRQIGRDAATRRNELVHAAGSLFVGSLTGGVVFGTFLATTGGQPITALAFLLVGSIALVIALS